MSEETAEARVICGAIAASCVCTKDPHPDDPVHACGRNCTGQWTGEDGTPSFKVVSFPFPTGGDR